MKVAEASQEKCALCGAELVKPDRQLLNVGPASPVQRPDGSIVCLGCDLNALS